MARCYTFILLEISRRTRWRCLKCVIVYLVQVIHPFVMYCVYGESGSSLLIESTYSMIQLITNAELSWTGCTFKQFKYHHRFCVWFFYTVCVILMTTLYNSNYVPNHGLSSIYVGGAVIHVFNCNDLSVLWQSWCKNYVSLPVAEAGEGFIKWADQRV